eukprot:759736-Hanusia_phi.AAC.2
MIEEGREESKGMARCMKKIVDSALVPFFISLPLLAPSHPFLVPTLSVSSSLSLSLSPSLHSASLPSVALVPPT